MESDREFLPSAVKGLTRAQKSLRKAYLSMKQHNIIKDLKNDASVFNQKAAISV